MKGITIFEILTVFGLFMSHYLAESINILTHQPHKHFQSTQVREKSDHKQRSQSQSFEEALSERLINEVLNKLGIKSPQEVERFAEKTQHKDGAHRHSLGKRSLDDSIKSLSPIISSELMSSRFNSPKYYGPLLPEFEAFGPRFGLPASSHSILLPYTRFYIPIHPSITNPINTLSFLSRQSLNTPSYNTPKESLNGKEHVSKKSVNGDDTRMAFPSSDYQNLINLYSHYLNREFLKMKTAKYDMTDDERDHSKEKRQTWDYQNFNPYLPLLNILYSRPTVTKRSFDTKYNTGTAKQERDRSDTVDKLQNSKTTISILHRPPRSTQNQPQRSIGLLNKNSHLLRNQNPRSTLKQSPRAISRGSFNDRTQEGTKVEKEQIIGDHPQIGKRRLTRRQALLACRGGLCDESELRRIPPEILLDEVMKTTRSSAGGGGGTTRDLNVQLALKVLSDLVRERTVNRARQEAELARAERTMDKLWMMG